MGSSKILDLLISIIIVIVIVFSFGMVTKKGYSDDSFFLFRKKDNSKDFRFILIETLPTPETVNRRPARLYKDQKTGRLYLINDAHILEVNQTIYTFNN